MLRVDFYSCAGRRLLIYVPQSVTVQDCHKLLGDTLRSNDLAAACMSVGFIVAVVSSGCRRMSGR